ncbi:hypothetical protein NQ543_01700 [Thomasclavelia spiroformis DSM 1552]|uniref:Uncharacterized protein n=1 Tax=Thomasclavelia spiroformis DSM 1552 TaxID=428126 RepID=B1C023_9FIRM|nr:hypothetical protein [Thomasclavelia spiroformis]EDS75513.1 hypothetical protein CLOSPI_00550 [Thomasclavelia spiroformis DSM 1552]UWO89987.1 hypothetical protein NQ543_01700 [Thomasclavelia spiroformis DSM 1552]
MEKVKDYLKLFTYIFYPGIVFILYLSQILEGNLGINLIFCPTDLAFMAVVLILYVIFDMYKISESKLIKKIKKDDGRYKLSFMFIFIILLVLLMSLYDDLKVYFYLNNNVSVNLIIVFIIWLVLFGICYFIDMKQK